MFNQTAVAVVHLFIGFLVKHFVFIHSQPAAKLAGS